ncbi:MAG: SGNH/GDSL hydrolase family protein [Dysgonamonadaceae bacterium]|jgi:lysophospholipase L1-like esterase|nr:SGNH/GDSL hydrolase family protein [Dysgonamonadaceae bacterium]
MKAQIFNLFILSFLSLHAIAQQVSPFKENDRVVFLGNSITDGGHYHSYIWLYYMTRFPDRPLTVLNAGVGGDRAEEMFKRLDGDVFSKKPTVLITTFGMNDTGYFEYNEPGAEAFADKRVNESHEWYKKIESRLKKLSGTRLVLMGSSPYDETAQIENNAFRNKNKAMMRIVDFQRKAALENKWEFIDLNAPMTEINERMQKTNPSFTLCGKDRIHPDNDGHMVMAYLFLKAQGFAGKEVAAIDIDAANAVVKSESNCVISHLKKTDAGLSFNYLAKALPYPLDTIARGWEQQKGQAKALEVIPFMDEMNGEILKVSGLNGNYTLLIDDEEIGTWTAEDFSKGINLAALTHTPQYQQALKIMHLNEERLDIEHRFRDYMWMEYTCFGGTDLLFACNRAALKELDKHLDNGWVRAKRDIYVKAMLPEVREAWQNEMDLLVSTIYKINQPVVRKITLIRS